MSVDVLDFPDAAGWESWLEAQHGERAEAWLRIAKRHSGIATITIAEALDVALCFGWIDGQRKANDEVSFLQRYSRRRPRSSWSKVNVAKVEALTGGRADAAGGARGGRGRPGGRTVGGGVRVAAHRRGAARSGGRAGRRRPRERRLRAGSADPTGTP